jgi:tRNA (cytidine/uridine-2'-O-)-methyltransferase
MPVNVVLFQPEIPPNTGNIIRLCANSGARLHLVRPLGFRLDARAVRRAGLDYRELADLTEHASLPDCLASLDHPRWFAFTTRGSVRYDAVRYADGDVLVFGPETRGLPDELLDSCPEERRLRIPMRPGARCLNLSNAVAVAVYEAWRQADFGQPAG